jgi:DNA-binding NarL/FixJ family response regulator
MPNFNGIEAASRITEKRPETAVVILSMHADESYVLRALKSIWSARISAQRLAGGGSEQCHSRSTPGKSIFQPGDQQNVGGRLHAPDAATQRGR